MALIRNLRNILEYANETIDHVCEQLTNEQKVLNSRLLPFRFATALEEVEKLSFDNTQKVIIALSQACDIALQNVPKFDGKTLVALDISGSMEGLPSRIGSLFSAVLLKTNAGNADFMVFDTSSKVVNINPMDSTLSIAKCLRFNGGGTDFKCIFESLIKKFDRIIILSDMQSWAGSPSRVFAEYKQKTDANPIVYTFDLQNTGTMQFPESKVYCIAGWSEQVFELMKLLESDQKALINTIEEIVL